MKNKEQIDQQVNAAFNALNTIEEVKVNHFFKHKVLRQLAQQKKEKAKIFAWFTPQLQMASLALIVLLNASAILYAFSSSTTISEISLESFAQEYSLQSETNSFLN